MFFCHYPIISREGDLPIYLVSIGMHDCQPFTRRGTEYGYPQIFYCTTGSGMLRYDGTQTEIKPGMGFFIPASYPHEYYPLGDVWDNHALLARMESGSGLRFVLDVWEHEPDIIRELIPYAALTSPHIAGYSLEGKLNGTSMIAQRLIEKFGIDAELPEPSSVLPKAECFEVSVDGEISEQVIMKLIHLVYNVERDDGIFRNTYSDAASFDLMRKNYPVRREWSSLKVNSDSQLLKKLGFRVNE